MEPQMRPTYTTLRSSYTTQSQQLPTNPSSQNAQAARLLAHHRLEFLHPALTFRPEPPTCPAAGQKGHQLQEHASQQDAREA